MQLRPFLAMRIVGITQELSIGRMGSNTTDSQRLRKTGNLTTVPKSLVGVVVVMGNGCLEQESTGICLFMIRY